jgi:hypothetical protein
MQLDSETRKPPLYPAELRDQFHDLIFLGPI